MAKLSDIFGRRGSEGDAPPRHTPGNANGNTGRYVTPENFSDAGARMGEENGNCPGFLLVLSCA